MMVDTTLGVCTSYMLLSILEAFAFRMDWNTLHSGHYRDTDSEDVDLEAWAIQLMTWGCIVSLVPLTQGKTMLIGCMWMTADQLRTGGHLLLDMLEDSPRLELIVVMVIAPLLMNLLQFWVQDTILKEHKREFPLMHQGSTSC